MKKVINITIGQVIFSIEEDAYDKLSKYLNSIRKHFAKDKDRDEIIEDIEVSIAEKFLKKQKKKNIAVSQEDVENVIEQMGTVKDFGKETSDDSSEGKAKDKSDIRKLYRDPDDVIIAGVASGLSEFFGIETALMRLIFAISVLFGGLGIVMYIILWVIVPVAETSTQKFEMRGEKMTLQQIEKAAKEGVDNLKKKDFGGLNKFFVLAGKAAKIFLKVILYIVGISFLIAGIAGIAATSFAFAWVAAGVGVGIFNLAISDFVILSGAPYWIFVTSLYLTAVIPIIVIFLLGLSIVKMKNQLNTFKILSIFAVWFIAIGFTGSILLQNANTITSKSLEIRDQVRALEKICENKNHRVEAECIRQKLGFGKPELDREAHEQTIQNEERID